MNGWKCLVGFVCRRLSMGCIVGLEGILVGGVWCFRLVLIKASRTIIMAQVEDAPAVSYRVSAACLCRLYAFYSFQSEEAQDILQSRVLNVRTSTLRYALPPSLHSRLVSVI
ncbi:hypothetical protein TWF506_002494 [Arthrobotrys conoides]|uniref:Uncharacterized protein n=1 Tax=Arthrobotrys conoides TaxID=74498 RepID=A0AAN8NIF4_9PEZI